MAGRFITFEGGEGSGKSTQVRRLAAYFREHDLACVTTREPGGTAEGESLRGLLVGGHVDRWSSEAEALLMYAARDVHLRQVIRPALNSGATVICDRFMDSTRVYQGIAGGCDMALIDHMERVIVGNTRPAMTLIFDLDPMVGLARAAGRGNEAEQRFEAKGLAFHEKLRKGFLSVARLDSARCRVIGASRPEDEVFAGILAAIGQKHG